MVWTKGSILHNVKPCDRQSTTKRHILDPWFTAVNQVMFRTVRQHTVLQGSFGDSSCTKCLGSHMGGSSSGHSYTLEDHGTHSRFPFSSARCLLGVEMD
jgi:hypothetical protein